MLSDNELAVLRVFWSTRTPLSRPEILSRMRENNWNPNSIHRVLNSLMQKGYIRVEGIARCGQNYGRTYRAIKDQSDYVADVALHAIPNVPEDECVLDVMSAMVKRKNISEKTITMLEQMLAKRREELRQEAVKDNEKSDKE